VTAHEIANEAAQDAAVAPPKTLLQTLATYLEPG